MRAVSTVGAPLLTAYPPAPGSASGRFDHWIESRNADVAELLQALTLRWRPLASFMVVLFDHPADGRCGALMMTTAMIDLSHRRERLRRLSVIPFRELGPFLERWERGETVLTSVDEMPEALARRYLATEVVWSLNVPIRCDGEWIGVIGATAAAAGFDPDTISSYESARRLLEREYEAETAWQSFQDSLTAFASPRGVRAASGSRG